MPRDLVAEKKHSKELKRKKIRLFERLKSGGSAKHAYGPPGNDPTPARKGHSSPGPKKYKWRRDVLKKK